MAATDINVLTIIVPNPQFDGSKNARIVNASIGYEAQLNSGFTTLSPNNPNDYNTIEGLYYAPNQGQSDTCNASSSRYIPYNVTNDASFPSNQNYPLVAVFPWTSIDCIQYYLSSCRADAVRGAVTFQPGNESPPPVTDNSWSLQDNGRWRSDNQFPIYAVPASFATSLLTGLGQYSGNMSQAPFGNQLVRQYDPRDLPRLFARVDITGGVSVPSLWIFLIIVLAVLLGIVIITSVVMHLLQRHQRAALQRRFERGEVDLESLGIKKMNVPQEKIDEMPKYTYIPTPEDSVVPGAAGTASLSKSANTDAKDGHATAFSQLTCPICLDDFVAHETTIRELPCKHIFHPECIDLFLRDSSSLCPLCKKSALPPGYCPVKITNLMVRRERLVRRMQERRQNETSNTTTPGDGSANPHRSAVSRVLGAVPRTLGFGRGGAPTSTPYVMEADRRRLELLSNRQNDIEMTAAAAAAARAPPSNGVSQTRQAVLAASDNRRETVAIPAEIVAQGPSARRAWRRERFARQQEQQFQESEAQVRRVDESRPLWRRAVNRVLPGAVD